MRELQFVAAREAEWAAWDRWLQQTAPGFRRRRDDAAAGLPIEELPRRFRRLCHDLSLAHDRAYSSGLQERLHALVLAAHQRIYGARKRDRGSILDFALHGFPALVRREWRVMSAAGLLFFLPLAVIIVALQFHPDGVYLLMSPETALRMEEMYSPTAPHLGRPREASSEWMMWGFYIANNVRIDFQSFAGGIAFGLGAVFFMIYNGLFIGAVAGHLTQLGYIDTFWGFVAGHSAFELTGAVLSGAAGLKLGMALVAPGARSRARALREDGGIAVRLLVGAAFLTFCAAFIEAFWSPQRLPVGIKYAVGAAFWTLTWGYLLFAGRERDAA